MRPLIVASVGVVPVPAAGNLLYARPYYGVG